MTRLAIRALPFALAVLAGIAQALSIAFPGTGEPLWWLQLLSLGVLAWLLQRASSWRAAALTGWLFATAWLVQTFWWLFVSMHVYGGLASPLAGLAVFALAAFLALYYGAAAAVFARWRGRAPVSDDMHFAALKLLAELQRDT